MARYLGPKNKLKRRFGLLEDKKSKIVKKRKKSDYGLMLEEKQKMKFIYGVMERQLSNYVAKAQKTPGAPTNNLLILLEKRLDNVVYRLGFAGTRQQARQLVSHRHVLVNEKKVNIPSYQVKPGQILKIDPKIADREMIQEALKNRKSDELPSWLTRNVKQGRIISDPDIQHLRKDLDISKVIEFYTK